MSYTKTTWIVNGERIVADTAAQAVLIQASRLDKTGAYEVAGLRYEAFKDSIGWKCHLTPVFQDETYGAHRPVKHPSTYGAHRPAKHPSTCDG